MKSLANLACVAALALSGGAALEVQGAKAGGAEWFPYYYSCTTANCSASYRIGLYNAGYGPDGYTASVYLKTGYCFRLEVMGETADNEINILSPTGALYYNDDKGGSSNPLSPLVKFNVPTTGFYNIRISPYAGGNYTAYFYYYMNLYNANNPNCGTPTVPRLTTTAVKAAAAGAAAAAALPSPQAR